MAPKTNLRAFFDTNVIFSGLYSPHGIPGTLLRWAVSGDFAIVVSQQVLEELVRTINLKLPEALPALWSFLTNIRLQIVPDPSPESLEPWIQEIHPADAVVLAAAIVAGPDYFVTGDSHFFDNPRIADRSGIILTPAQFLAVLEVED